MTHIKTQTEPRHFEEFLFSEEENDISREVADVKSGEVLLAGDVVEFDSGELVKATGAVDTAGELIANPVGILSHDADADNTEGFPKAVYIARLAQVVDALVNYPADSAAKARVKAYLRDKLFIIQR